MILGRHRLRSALWLACVLAVLVSPTAFADDWDDEEDPFYFEGGTYFSVGYSYVAEDVGGKIGQSSKGKGFHRVDGNVKDAEGINAVFGKRAWEYLGFEAQFEYSDGFDLLDTDGEHFGLKVYTTTLNAKIYPFYSLLRGVNEGRIQPHLIAGVGLMVTHDLEIDTGASAALRAGGGLDYFINEKWAVNLKTSYVYPFGVLKGLRFVTSSIGLSYQLE